MGKRNVSISYLADIDTLYVHFESKAGFYDTIPGDDHVQARYDEDGKVVGFMVEGLKDIEGWLDIELADAVVEATRR
jgi:uncharacterized protein YuzE